MRESRVFSNPVTYNILLQILMNVLLTMEDVPITVTIQLEVIIVNVLLDILFDLTIMTVQVRGDMFVSNICIFV